MDKFSAEPKEIYEFSEYEFYPYLNQYNRETFLRSDTKNLFQKLNKTKRDLSIDNKIGIHIPFTEDEHLKILQYLLLTKYYDPNIPLHCLPFQVMRSMHHKSDNDWTIPRSADAIIQYLTDIYIRKSIQFNAEDEPIILSQNKDKFPKRSNSGVRRNLKDPIESIGMTSKTSKPVKIQMIHYNAAALFITDVPPIVIDLTTLQNSQQDKGNFKPYFLMSRNSNFAISGNIEFCADMNRFCCFYENGVLNFIDLQHRVILKDNNTVIKSFKTWPYPCFENLTMLCSSFDPPKPDNMVIAASINSESISIWEFDGNNHTVNRWGYELKPIKLEWINQCRLVIVTEDQNIKIIPFPLTDEGLDQHEFSMETPHRFVECQGDAFVLEEIPPEDNLEQNERISNFTHKIKIITHNENTFEIIADQMIEKCAYSQNSFAFSTDKGEIFIWDHLVKHTRSYITVNEPIKQISPICDPKNHIPMFLCITNHHYQFFNKYGKTSQEFSIEPNVYLFDQNKIYISISDDLQLLVYFHNG